MHVKPHLFATCTVDLCSKGKMYFPQNRSSMDSLVWFPSWGNCHMNRESEIGPLEFSKLRCDIETYNNVIWIHPEKLLPQTGKHRIRKHNLRVGLWWPFRIEVTECLFFQEYCWPLQLSIPKRILTAWKLGEKVNVRYRISHLLTEQAQGSAQPHSASVSTLLHVDPGTRSFLGQTGVKGWAGQSNWSQDWEWELWTYNTVW